jgi:hypothetical protein
MPDDRSHELHHAGWVAARRGRRAGPAQPNAHGCHWTKTVTAADSTLRIVGWNVNGGLTGRKAACLAALNPGVAGVAECAENPEVPGLIRVGWTDTYRTAGLGVFAL